MSKSIKVSAVAVFIVLGGLYWWLTKPIKIEQNLDGVYYQLGGSGSSATERIKVNLSGTAYRNLKGFTKYVGTVDVSNLVLPKAAGTWELQPIQLDLEGSGHISYFAFHNGKMDIFHYGELYTNRAMTQWTITVYEQSPTDAISRGWTSKDGFMVSAPASTREEALNISNELMGDAMFGKLR
ncbi:hypothetical protein [Paenibacillus gansuensis]|uniref:DUF4367 domain-containing protein n=1 Tax=Paenibacillus gansuensis TaxID=306542 RepID=A0ABW5PIN4_9BACL